jgi:hypothetical protein
MLGGEPLYLFAHESGMDRCCVELNWLSRFDPRSDRFQFLTAVKACRG